MNLVTAITPEEATARLIANREADLVKFCKATNRWFAEVNRRLEGMEPKRVAMPSKDRKHYAYDYARAIEQHRGVPAEEAARTFPALCALVGITPVMVTRA